MLSSVRFWGKGKLGFDKLLFFSFLDFYVVGMRSTNMPDWLLLSWSLLSVLRMKGFRREGTANAELRQEAESSSKEAYIVVIASSIKSTRQH